MASLRPSSFALHARQLQHRLILRPAIRHASNSIPKPRLLEKPERFNPPSHPSRLQKKRPRNYGAPLSENELSSQKTRQYPHMMPPEGSFMHWFLTNRSIHLWISLGILIFLTTGIWYQDFIHTTPYKDLLPPNSLFFAHPFKFLARYIEVYDMHAGYVSAQTAERRRAKVEDVKKRSDYRKAHGLNEGEGIFGGWTAKEDDEVLGAEMREGGAAGGGSGTTAAEAVAVEAAAGQVSESAIEIAEVQNALVAAKEVVKDKVEEGKRYVDFEGKEQQHEGRKKWFGIW